MPESMVELKAAPGHERAVVVAVPARLASSRLPGKVMAEIGGQPMLRHVLERCRQARGVETVLACSDSEEVLDAAANWGFKGILTAEHCSSGSERLASVVDQILECGGASPEATLVINVQADQPFLDPSILEGMIEKSSVSQGSGINGQAWLPVITPVYSLVADKIHDPDVVKVLRAGDGRAITFSRSAIPHVRGVSPHEWHGHTVYWGHVGVYGFRGDVLKDWCCLPESRLENLEKLEQLRLIEAGVPIATFVVESDCFSVDTQAQLDKARRIAEGL